MLPTFAALLVSLASLTGAPITPYVIDSTGVAHAGCAWIGSEQVCLDGYVFGSE